MMMSMLSVVTTVWSLSLGEVTEAHQWSLLQLPEGEVRGRQEMSDSGEPYYSYYGIPYALPPTGSRRFRRPEPVEKWGRTVGEEEDVECAQEATGREEIFSWSSQAVRGREDCLILNIYKPASSSSLAQQPQPVIFFIHGGGYFAGSAAPGVYGPEYFMDHDVILVTVNYRLGPLGFLSLGDSELAGNQALWDLVLALQFINKRIHHFGGDKTRVTLMGHSAGAMAVQFLMFNLRLQGLFRAAILQSGPVISAYSCSDKHPAYYTRTLAAAVGCDPAANSSVLLLCLQSTDLAKVVGAVRVVDQQPDVVRNAPSPWKPIMDSHFLPEDEAFLLGDPWSLLKEKKFLDIPVIIGHTKDEGLYAVTEAFSRNPATGEVIFQEWDYKRGPGYLFGREEDEVSDQEKIIAQEFRQKFLRNGNDLDPRILQNWFGPSIWTAPTLETAELLAGGKTSPTYLYYYTHPGTLSLADLLSFPVWKLLAKLLASHLNIDLFPNTLNCSTHFDEIFLLFKGRNIPFLKRHSAGDRKVSENLLKLWTNFARTERNPVIETSDDYRLEWEPFNAHNRKHLRIETETFQMQNLSVFDQMMEFFHRVYQQVPPSIHLLRSKTWNDSRLFADSGSAKKVEL